MVCMIEMILTSLKYGFRIISNENIKHTDISVRAYGITDSDMCIKHQSIPELPDNCEAIHIFYIYTNT